MSPRKKSNNLAGEIGKRRSFASLSQETYLNLVRTHSLLSGEFAGLFKQHGISDPQYNVLRILQGEKRPMQIYEIAERLVSPQSDISRLIERMGRKGLIERNRSNEDRRVVWIGLTAEGHTLLKKLARPVAELHQRQFRGLSPDELAQLNQLLFHARNQRHP